MISLFTLFVLNTLLCTTIHKCCVVACKSSHKNIPFLGWYLAASGSVFVDKDDSLSARISLENAARDIVGDKISIFVFPEGTRSYATEPRLLPFKKGAFHLAVGAKVPIVPLVCGNYSGMLSHENLKFGSGVIPVNVLKPINISKLTAADVDELTRSTRDIMLREAIDMARDKSALVSKEEIAVAVQGQE